MREDFQQRTATTPRSFNYGVPNASAALLDSSLESENADEEKVIRDNSTSEKLKFAFMGNSLIVSYIQVYGFVIDQDQYKYEIC